MNMALEGRDVLLPRPMTADWINSRDAADGIARLCHAANLNHDVYHVSGGAWSDLTQWCGTISELIPGFRWTLANTDQPGNVVYSLPKDRAPLGIARLRADTGFQPSRDLKTAACEYLDWVGGEHASPARASEADRTSRIPEAEGKR
jgi:UDP-glucose 4-epimerase/UDP-glucuronate 4-epimerase